MDAKRCLAGVGRGRPNRLLGQPRPLRSRSWRIEMFVGLMLLFRRALRLTLFLLVAQMVGTFLTFIILSEVTDGTRCC